MTTVPATPGGISTSRWNSSPSPQSARDRAAHGPIDDAGPLQLAGFGCDHHPLVAGRRRTDAADILVAPLSDRPPDDHQPPSRYPSGPPTSSGAGLVVEPPRVVLEEQAPDGVQSGEQTERNP